MTQTSLETTLFKQSQAAGNAGTNTRNTSVLPKGGLTGILTNAKGPSGVHGAAGGAEGNSGKIRPGGYPPSKRKQGNAGLPMSI